VTRSTRPTTEAVGAPWPPEDEEAADALLAALERSAHGIARCDQAADVLTRVAEGAATVVPGVLDAGVVVRGPAGLACAAHTTETAAALDRAATEMAEGPCVDAVERAGPVVLADAAVEMRWPRFVQEARGHGVRACVSVPFSGSWPVGALTLHLTGHALTDPALRRQVRRDARIFTLCASIALAGARRVEHLEQAVGRRDVIGQAKGILMVQHGIDAEEAFTRLRDASQHTNIKLYDIAAWLSSRDGT
jgi:hypothetical protein